MSVQEDFDKKVAKFLDCMKSDSAHRYRSWDHCYLFFRKLLGRANNQSITDDDMKSACLNLAFYLASWGMYRGSSFLLQKDCTIYTEIIGILIKSDYWDLWDGGYYNEILSDRGELSISHSKITKIFKLSKELNSSFNRITYIKDRIPGRAKATDTLITKILLGTIGCVPAYDNFFKSGLKHTNISPCSSFSRKSLISVLGFIINNSLKIAQIPIKKSDGRDSGYFYPVMKMIDMYFWEIGYELDLKKKNRKTGVC